MKHCLHWLWGLLLLLSWPLAVAGNCSAQITQVYAAKSNAAQAADIQYWQKISLPDNWNQRWPNHSGVVWYRIDWQPVCQNTDELNLAVYVESISMAGSVYVNQQLLWRDKNQQEPISRSWNQPRYFVLPPNLDRKRTQQIYLRVYGHALSSPGIGKVQIDHVDNMVAIQQDAQWHQRTIFTINAILSASLGLFCACIWLMRRQESALGWYVVASMSWLAFLYNILATETGPFPNAGMFFQSHIMAFVLYTWGFCIFSWRFVQYANKRLEQVLNLITIVMIAFIWLMPLQYQALNLSAIFLTCVLILNANGVCISILGWRSRELESKLLAITLMTCILLAVLSLLGFYQIVDVPSHLLSYTSLLFTLFLAIILAMRFTRSLQRIEAFNLELSNKIREAELNVSLSLQEQHRLAVKQVQTKERTHMAHDLHDGLGGSILRSIITLEHAPKSIENAQNLSILRLLRNDLRQIIDQFADDNHKIPSTPMHWLAPLRNRYKHIFDELGIKLQWEASKEWAKQPTSTQCLTLYRVVEEALNNVVKHSQAKQVVLKFQASHQFLQLSIEDNGVGFNVIDTELSGLSTGMNSMKTRIERIDGQWSIASEPGKTTVQVFIAL